MEDIRTKMIKNKWTLSPKTIISGMYYVIGITKMSSFQYANAIKWFKKAIETSSKSPFIDLCYKYLAISFVDNKQYTEGKYYLHKAIELKKEDEYDSEIYSRLGWLYYLENDHEKAASNFKKALAKYKKNDFVNLEAVKKNLDIIEGEVNRRPFH